MDEGPNSTEHVDAYHDDREEPGEILEQPLAKVPRRETLLVASSEPVGEVITKMNESGHGCALVMEGDRLVGIFTERDVLKKMAGRGMDASKVVVQELMSRDPHTLPEDASVAFALNRMSVEGYRHIPLVDDDGSPVGVVGMRDIINWMVELYPNRVLNVPPEPSSYPTKAEGR
jgi:CBS domain-containing protein